jgi:hypothetical protein
MIKCISLADGSITYLRFETGPNGETITIRKTEAQVKQQRKRLLGERGRKRDAFLSQFDLSIREKQTYIFFGPDSEMVAVVRAQCREAVLIGPVTFFKLASTFDPRLLKVHKTEMINGKQYARIGTSTKLIVVDGSEVYAYERHDWAKYSIYRCKQSIQAQVYLATCVKQFAHLKDIPEIRLATYKGKSKPAINISELPSTGWYDNP